MTFTVGGDEPVVHVLHDNPEWIGVFERAFAAEGVPLRAWRWDELVLRLNEEPPPGVYWSRLSASAHTRGVPNAKDAAHALLAWLESWDRRVVGGSSVAALEVSKVAQHVALRRAGIDVPRTTAITDPHRLLEAAAEYPAPFILKHNQGGKGLGVRRIDDLCDLSALVDAEVLDMSPDGIMLVQEYLPSRDGSITRAEFVGGRFAYAVRVDISDGGFELCPAEACAAPSGAAPQFTLRADVGAQHPLIRDYERFLRRHRIEIAGIEFVETPDGRVVTYDVNTNTNYHPGVEEAADQPATRGVARFLGGLLTEAMVEPGRHTTQQAESRSYELAAFTSPQ
ncbi:MAG: hypothetical protein K0Q52_3294 [Microbacterium sp.]|jgi:hypothetical protein|nr:hypothetical protein [Microbacterium sp.]